MNSAAEARFRVPAPNSTPRACAVIALDQAGEAVVRRLARGVWEHAAFLIAVSPDGALSDLAGRIRSAEDVAATADLVVLVAGPGGLAHAAPAIGRACSQRRVMTTALIVGVTAASDAALSTTLAQVRPWSLMVVMAGSEEYIDDMLTALRA